MKNIKFNINTSMMLVIAGLLMVSCSDFLKTQPKGALSSQIVNTKKGINTLLIGAYGALDGQGGAASNLTGGDPWAVAPDAWIYGSIVGGDAHKGSTPGDQADALKLAKGTITPDASYLDQKWQTVYEGIARTNSVLAALTNADDMSEGEKKEAEAEARFLRAYYYFDLTRMFNKVPWIDENTTMYKQPNDSTVWNHIEADFTFAMNNLPETQSEIGRANKWAAEAYLAKTYVFQQKWQKAKGLYDDIIPNGVTANGLKYKLVDKYEDNFRASTENNSETVFAIQYTARDGSPGISNSRSGDMLAFPYGGVFPCCGFYQPSQDLVNSYRTNPDGLPFVDSYNNNPVKSDYGVESDQHFTPSTQSLDPRLDWAVGRRGVPYLDWGPMPGKDWIRDQPTAGPYATKKNVYWNSTQDQYYDPNSWAPGTAINYNAIRFAGVLLMAAEAEVQVGSLPKAEEYVNRVRNRAANKSGWVDNNLNSLYAFDTVDNQADMLSEDVSKGDGVIRTDRNSTFVYLGGGAGDISNWQEYPVPNYNVEPYPTGSSQFSSKEGALEAIHFERKLELAMEGHRFFDLVRWNELKTKLNKYINYEVSVFGPTTDIAGGNFTDKNKYYPIPQNQIDKTTVDGKPTLTQNPGYQN